MTPIPEAFGCTSRTDLGERAPVRAEQLWPGANERETEAVEVRAVSGATGCQGALPAPPDCDLSLPWAGMDPEDLVRGTQAARVIRGRAYAQVAASSDRSPGAMSLTYVVLAFGPAKQRLDVARQWFAGAVERCRLGGPGSMGAVAGIVGERHKPTLGQSDAGHFLVATLGTRLVSLVFEGGAWSPQAREETVRRVVPLLAADDR